jgi:benzoylformate decarboxylase
VKTVREATYELLRERGMTTLFGNPGSTELPMLSDFPGDFRYVLGLQEAVAVGMADGFAQATGRPTLVNLHTAPGLGNAMGAICNAQVNKSPLVVTAGQQYRSLMTLQANLTNRDATRMPHPLVKWSYEPPCAQDVPHALARAAHTAALPPRGPVFVSVPMDDWYAEVRSEEEVRHQTTRAVSGGAGLPGGATLADLARRLAQARNPALVAGPDIDAAGGWDAAVALAERARLPVYATPATGGGRLGFPEDHPLFQAILPPAVQPLGEMLAPHDFVLAVGTSVFPYYPNIPGPLLAPGTSLVAVTSDPDEAARAPMGDAVVADVALTLAALAEAVGAGAGDAAGAGSTDAAGSQGAPGQAGGSSAALRREPPPVRAAPQAVPITDPMSPSTAVRALAEVFPEDGIVVLESPSATPALRNQLRLGRPGSYYFSAGGGLGFGMPAAVGVQLACPDRPVVCVVGEGSAQYAVQSFWTAAAYRVPVTFLVLRNEEYAILKFFSLMEETPGAPGLDLPALDTAAVAAGYGVNARSAADPEELGVELRRALASERPELVEVQVAPGMALA